MTIEAVFALVARAVKAERRLNAQLEGWCWYRAERIALWTLTRSSQHTALRRPASYSEAWRKGAIVRIGYTCAALRDPNLFNEREGG